jgi:hypothetical protein
MVAHPDPGFSATEVAEEFDKTRQWADSRLGAMYDDGLLRRKKGGQRSKWFWPSQEGKQTLRENHSASHSGSQ